MKRTLESSSKNGQADPLSKEQKLNISGENSTDPYIVSSSAPSLTLMEMLSQESYTQLVDMNMSSSEEMDQSNKKYDSAADKVSRSVSSFFESTWQLYPVLFKKKHETICKDQRTDSDKTKDPSTTQPLKSALSMGWNGVMKMLEHSRAYDQTEAPQSYHHLKPLFLQNQQPLQHTQIENKYSSDPFAAYLDGFSIIQNHAEYFSIPLSDLCLDLQKSFPHCYCNTYLTPPNSSTVKAHADDRDVFVIQIKGKKKWKVYRKVPIEYPYHHEQVGKNELPIPFAVTNDNSNNNDKEESTTLIETTLEEGDILYMPRGFVHEASTMNCDNQPSFHATVAIMTSDWSYSKTIADMTRKCLDQESKFRLAIDVDIGRERAVKDFTIKNLEMKLESIFQRMKKCITIENIGKELSTKYKLHNQSSDYYRKRLYLKEDQERNEYHASITGPVASRYVTLESKVRASTHSERESVSSGERGLTVREEISESLISVISKMKENMDLSYKVLNLGDLIEEIRERETICNFTLCSFVKCCVSLGVMSIA